MSMQNENLGVRNGIWGEHIAERYLRLHGFEIIDRNTRPVKKDQRLEIDLVAWESKTDTMVFVEVKQHAKLSPYAQRLRSINKAKLMNIRRAGNAWRRCNQWNGAYRFDVIEVYGTPEDDAPIIDHIDHVALFPQKGRFVKWN